MYKPDFCLLRYFFNNLNRSSSSTPFIWLTEPLLYSTLITSLHGKSYFALKNKTCQEITTTLRILIQIPFLALSLVHYSYGSKVPLDTYFSESAKQMFIVKSNKLASESYFEYLKKLKKIVIFPVWIISLA